MTFTSDHAGLTPCSRDRCGEVAARLEPLPGQVAIGVSIVDQLSSVTSAFSTAPLKLLVPRARGKSVWAFLSSFGGGMLGGDQTAFEAKVGPASRLFVSTQASTKVYRNPRLKPCSHRSHAVVADHALLVLAPDPLQAFAGSSYSQHQSFDLAPTANLILVDWISSGRAARGERWQFHSVFSRNAITVDSKLVFLDAIRLNGPETARIMKRYDCFATVVLIGPLFEQAAAELLRLIGSAPVARQPSLLESASGLDCGGMVLRLAGEKVECVARQIRTRLNFLTDLLGDDPWSRKW